MVHIGSHLGSGASEGTAVQYDEDKILRGFVATLAVGSSLDSASGCLQLVVMMQIADQTQSRLQRSKYYCRSGITNTGVSITFPRSATDSEIQSLRELLTVSQFLDHPTRLIFMGQTASSNLRDILLLGPSCRSNSGKFRF
jgi:hypothetical protein